MTANELPPINGRFPLIVVKRVYFDQYVAGTKTIEYRLHRGIFTAKALYPGRWVRIAPNFNIAKHPSLLARVTSFDVSQLGRIEGDGGAALRSVYPNAPADAEIALIGLSVYRGAGSAQGHD